MKEGKKSKKEWMNDRKVNQYNQQEKKRRTSKQSKSKEERKKISLIMSKSILCIFLSFSLTLLLSHSRSLTHFPTLLVFSAVSHTI